MIKIMKIGETAKEDILSRGLAAVNVEAIVRGILSDVRENGDGALYKYCKQFDGAELTSLEVTKAELEAALKDADKNLVEVMSKAAGNIEAYHRCQVRNGFIMNQTDGIVVGQRILPLERVGLYIPGGTASYPSTALMNCIPAKIAGVNEIVITTPPNRDGTVNPNILAAAQIAGADRIFKIGGAQAVAALAYGTESVPRVDKIMGPGNAYVAEAKKQVFGLVGIDMIAGPSEILVIADSSCNPKYIAADMLSQAEHDKMSTAVLITDSEKLARDVSLELEAQLGVLPRSEIARTSIEQNGKIIIADSILQAIDISNELAPEHLEVCVDHPFDYLDRIKNAGSIFLGKNCPEALGDYLAGPNHTLPTVGTARFSSPLSVDDFIKKSSFTYYTAEALKKVSGDIAYFAEKEGLSAHARSATVRFE
jgi:histidinol dehydrogenase